MDVPLLWREEWWNAVDSKQAVRLIYSAGSSSNIRGVTISRAGLLSADLWPVLMSGGAFVHRGLCPPGLMSRIRHKAAA